MLVDFEEDRDSNEEIMTTVQKKQTVLKGNYKRYWKLAQHPKKILSRSPQTRMLPPVYFTRKEFRRKKVSENKTVLNFSSPKF